MKILIIKHTPLICFLVSGQCIADWPILDSPIGGFATAEMSKELPIMHSVHYSPNFDCKPVYSYITQNFTKETGTQKTNAPIGLQVDNGTIYVADAGQDAFLTESTIAVYIPIDESDLPDEMKRGNKLYLRASDKKVISWVSLKGSSKGMNEAEKLCLSSSQLQKQSQQSSPAQTAPAQTVQTSIPNISSIPDLTSIEGKWVDKSADINVECASEESHWTALIGKWEFDQKLGKNIFGKGTGNKMYFLEGGCDFIGGKKQGNSFILQSECSDEGETSNGDTILTMISDSELQVISPITSTLSLVRCPESQPPSNSRVTISDGDIPLEFRGFWVPTSQACSSKLKFLVETNKVSFINDKDSINFNEVDLCYSCEGGANYQGRVVWITPKETSNNRVSFIAYFNADEKIGVTKIDIDDPDLKKRFPLEEVALKKCN